MNALARKTRINPTANNIRYRVMIPRRRHTDRSTVDLLMKMLFDRQRLGDITPLDILILGEHMNMLVYDGKPKTIERLETTFHASQKKKNQQEKTPYKYT